MLRRKRLPPSCPKRRRNLVAALRRFMLKPIPNNSSKGKPKKRKSRSLIWSSREADIFPLLRIDSAESKGSCRNCFKSHGRPVAVMPITDFVDTSPPSQRQRSHQTRRNEAIQEGGPRRRDTAIQRHTQKVDGFPSSDPSRLRLKRIVSSEPGKPARALFTHSPRAVYISRNVFAGALFASEEPRKNSDNATAIEILRDIFRPTSFIRRTLPTWPLLWWRWAPVGLIRWSNDDRQ